MPVGACGRRHWNLLGPGRRVAWAGAGPHHRDQPIRGAPPGGRCHPDEAQVPLIPSSPAQAPSGSECVCCRQTSCRRTLESGLTDSSSWRYLTWPACSKRVGTSSFSAHGGFPTFIPKNNGHITLLQARRRMLYPRTFTGTFASTFMETAALHAATRGCATRAPAPAYLILSPQHQIGGHCRPVPPPPRVLTRARFWFRGQNCAETHRFWTSPCYRAACTREHRLQT